MALAPGSSPGQVAITGDLTLDSDDTYPVELNGTNPATEYDNFIVSGRGHTGGRHPQCVSWLHARGWNDLYDRGQDFARRDQWDL